MFSVRTILHPTDFSESSEFAFRVARALARDHRAQLIILHVTPMPTFAFGQGLVFPNPGNDSDELNDQIRELQPASYPIPLDYQTRQGNPASAILQVAKEVRADLIVMGTHGRRGWPRFVMGSVAEQVVRDASCAVLTLTTPASELGQRRAEPAAALQHSSFEKPAAAMR